MAQKTEQEGFPRIEVLCTFLSYFDCINFNMTNYWKHCSVMMAGSNLMKLKNATKSVYASSLG